MDTTAPRAQLAPFLSWGVLGTLGAVAWWAPGGCAGPLEDPGTATGPAGDVLEATLRGVADEVVLPALRVAASEADALEAATAAWAANPTSTAERAAAQDAWTEAMASWQVVEVLQIGPAAPSLTAVGGEDVRDYVYSWPTINPCRVDQETVDEDYTTQAFFDDERVNVLGLDAIEYLLWAPAENACPSQVDINTSGSWDALGDAGTEANRAAYAAAAAADVSGRIDGLLATWEGGFADQLAQGSGVYASQQEALNAVFDGLFYVEKMTKDRKLGTPVGDKDCSADSCPEQAEALPSGTSDRWLAVNIATFRQVFEGGDGWGFDDLLVDQGHSDLADAMAADLDATEAALAALSGPIDELVVAAPAEADEAHEAMKRVGALLKGDVATVLTLAIPAEAAGDND